MRSYTMSAVRTYNCSQTVKGINQNEISQAVGFLVSELVKKTCIKEQNEFVEKIS